MTTRATDQLVSSLLSGLTFPLIFNGGSLKLYTGSIPADPAAGPTGTLLGSIVDQTGFAPQYELVGSTIGLKSDRSWKFQAVAIGVPGYALFTPNSGFAGAVLMTDQLSFPAITSLAASISLTTFYFTLMGQ